MAEFAGLNTTDPVVNAETRQPAVIAIAATLSFLSLTALLLRLYTRTYLVKFAGIDDVTIIIAEILALATAIGATMEVKHGLGRHTWTVSDEDALIQLKWLYFVIIAYNFSTNVIKLSFLLQYRRLFAGTWTNRICNWGIILIFVWAIVQVTILGLACLPLASIVPSMKDKCLPATPVWTFSSAMNIVTDFAIFTIPLPSVLRLRATRGKQKFLLVIIFSLGFFTCIISVIRIFTLTQRTKSKDIFWTGIYPAIWSIVEIHCGIICSCLATLRPILRRYFPWLAGFSKPSDISAPYEMRFFTGSEIKPLDVDGFGSVRDKGTEGLYKVAQIPRAKLSPGDTRTSIHVAVNITTRPIK